MINKSLYTIFKTIYPLSKAAEKYKIPILFFIFLIVFIMPPLNYGQDYFPLQVGNRWVYQHIDEFYLHECDIREIIDSVQINNKHYFYFREKNTGLTWFNYYYMRKDSANQVWVFDGEHPEIITHKFNLSPGSCWIDSSRYLTYRITLESTDEIVSTPAGQFDSCYYFNTLIEELYTDFRYFYAPNIGLVRSMTEGLEIVLKGALVNNVLYGDTTYSHVNKHNQTADINYCTLYQNYPNPFNISTKIAFTITGKISTDTIITIFNIIGTEVKNITRQFFSPGNYEVTWDGTDNYGKEVGSGVYIVELNVGQFRQIKKMILTK